MQDGIMQTKSGKPDKRYFTRIHISRETLEALFHEGVRSGFVTTEITTHDVIRRVLNEVVIPELKRKRGIK